MDLLEDSLVEEVAAEVELPVVYAQQEDQFLLGGDAVDGISYSKDFILYWDD